MNEHPPTGPTGICVVCNGTVIAEYVLGVTDRLEPIDAPQQWIFKGYHCKRCGLSYRFPPPEGILTR